MHSSFADRDSKTLYLIEPHSILFVVVVAQPGWSLSPTSTTQTRAVTPLRERLVTAAATHERARRCHPSRPRRNPSRRAHDRSPTGRREPERRRFDDVIG